MRTKTLEIITILFIMLTLLISPLLTITPGATETKIQPRGTEQSYQSQYATTDGNIDSNASLNDFEARVEGKTVQIVKLVQTVCKPICVIAFIISVLVAIFGAIGKGGVTKGLVGAFLSAGAYVCVNYAFEIVLFIQNYLIS